SGCGGPFRDGRDSHKGHAVRPSNLAAGPQGAEFRFRPCFVCKTTRMDSLDDMPAHQADVAEGLRRRAVRGGMLLIGTRLVTQVFVWGATLLVARFLTASDYGIMTVGVLFVGLADLLAEVGVGRALIQKEDLIESDWDEGFSLTFLLGV